MSESLSEGEIGHLHVCRYPSPFTSCLDYTAQGPVVMSHLWVHSALLTLHVSSVSSTLTTTEVQRPWPSLAAAKLVRLVFKSFPVTHPSLPGRLSLNVETGGGRSQADLPVFKWRSVRSKHNRTRDGRGEVLNTAPTVLEALSKLLPK